MILQESTSTASSELAPQAIGPSKAQNSTGDIQRGGEGWIDLYSDSQKRLQELKKQRTAETKVCLQLMFTVYNCLQPNKISVMFDWIEKNFDLFFKENLCLEPGQKDKL